MPGKKRSAKCGRADGDGGVKAHRAATDAQKPEAEQIFEVLLLMQSVQDDPEAIYLDWKEFERLAPELAKKLPAQPAPLSFTDGNNDDMVVSDVEYKSLVPNQSNRLAPEKGTSEYSASDVLFFHAFHGDLLPTLYLSPIHAMRIVREAVYLYV